MIPVTYKLTEYATSTWHKVYFPEDSERYIKVIRLHSSLNSKRLFSFSVRYTLKTEVNYCVNNETNKVK